MITIKYGDERLSERFWNKVSPCPMSGCWLWTATLRGGYGRFFMGHLRSAHRLSYEALVGAIPEELEIDHLCRVRCCVNPLHLEGVTRTVNVRRGVSPIAQNHTKTICSNGHPFDDSNTYKWRKRRFCRACVNAAVAAWKVTHRDEEREYQRQYYLANRSTTK